MSDAAPEAASAFYPPRADREGGTVERLASSLSRRASRLLGVFRQGGERSAFHAAALSLAAPGLGHYWIERKGWKAAAIFGTFLLLLSLWLRGAVAFFFLFAVHQWTIADSYIKACVRNGAARPSGWGAVFISLAAAAFLVAAYCVPGRLFASAGGTARVSTRSLRPVLDAGDLIFVGWQGDFKRGDLAVIRYGSESEIERVVALPGETVRVDRQRIFIDGEPLPPELYPISRSVVASARLDGAEMRVGEGSYFVILPWFYRRAPGENPLAQYVFPAGRIRGKVAYRLRPGFRRFP